MYRLLRLTLLACVIAALSLSANLRADPEPGEVWREYRVALGADGFYRIGGQFGGASNLDRNYPLGPFRAAPANPQPTPYVLDLEHAIKAELTVGYNQGHSGAPVLHVSINNNPYQQLVRPASILNSGYFFHIYPTVTIPLGQLQPTNNVYKFTNSKWLSNPATYEAGYDQSLLYEMVLRVYYDPALKPHPTGAITSPTAGGSLVGTGGARPVITAEATGASRVDFLGLYDDFDRNGDTLYRRWHYRLKHFNRNAFIDLIDHIGTDTSAPFSTTWNVEWLPNQTQPMQISAFLTAPDGVMTMLQPVTGVNFVRPDRHVELARPTLTPPNFKSSSSRIQDRTAKFSVAGLGGDLRQATAARFMFQFWPGGDNEDMGLTFNAADHHPFFYPAETFPTEYLRVGENTIELDKGGEHGMEILWPGLGVYIAYDTRPAPSVVRQPKDLAVLPGGAARFETRFAGSPAPTYQWQMRPRNGAWADLSGATSPVLDLGVPELGADGSQYRVVASNSAGSTTSAAATLRVSTVLPSSQPVNGLISIEAENYDVQALNGETYGWMILDDVKVPFSGSSYLWNYYHNTTVSTWGAAATVRYRFRVAEAGNYFAWLRVRGRALNKNHTVIVGFDGIEHRSLYPDKTTSAWIWIPAPVKALGAGEHTFDMMRRSDGLMVDKIVITSDAAYAPATVNAGFGPAETPRDIFISGATRIISPTSSTVVRPGDSVTLLGEGVDLVWTVSGAVSASGTGPTLSLVVPETAGEGASLSITLVGSNGTETLSLPIVTPPRPFREIGGVVVFEAEDSFTEDKRTDASPWGRRSDVPGYAGTGFVTIGDATTTARTWSTGALLSYDVNFSTPGNYSVWLRVFAGDGDSNSAFFGFADTDPAAFFDNQTSTGWTWRKAPYTLAVGSAGLRTLALINREDGYSIDRILLVVDSVYDPSTIAGGVGPAVSGRVGDVTTINYSSWSGTVTWPVDADTSPSGDPDGDGMPNAWEQFLAADPLAGDAPSFVPNLRAEEGRTFLRWSLVIDPQTDQSLFVRTSTDLATWSEAILVYPSAAALPAGMSVTRSGAEGEALQIEIETPEQGRFFQRFVLESR
jgi:hypothetical protein